MKNLENILNFDFNTDLANIDNVQLEDVGDGLFFGTFTENSKDGIIKLTPGGLKVERKTKKGDIVSFFLILFKIYRLTKKFFSETSRNCWKCGVDCRRCKISIDTFFTCQN